MHNECVFCNLKKNRVLRESENTCTVLSDPYLLEGHLLVIPKKHFVNLSEISDNLLLELFKEIRFNEELLFDKIGAIGIDIRQNYRPFLKDSKFKVSHLHFHVIPRTFEDELYKKSMIYEKNVFKDLTDYKLNEILIKLK